MSSGAVKNILITGGLGFIGSNLIRKLLINSNHRIINIDFNGYSSDQHAFDYLFSKKENLEKDIHNLILI